MTDIRINNECEAHPISNGTRRAQEFRRRRRDGLRLIPMEIPESEIAAMVDLGKLDPAHVNNNKAVAIALWNFYFIDNQPNE